jgi:hypothetical protein
MDNYQLKPFTDNVDHYFGGFLGMPILLPGSTFAIARKHYIPAKSNQRQLISHLFSHRSN